jgi:diacylglycerol kinase (ATP)
MDDNGPCLSSSGRIRSVKCALQGIRVMLRSQQNAWVHLAATIVVVVFGISSGPQANECCWITLAIMSVWWAEALNTAFEFLTDVAAGAVLISAIGAVIVWVFWYGTEGNDSSRITCQPS